MIRGSKGKAIYFPAKVLQSQNDACKSSLVDSTEACVLYASVLCEGENGNNDECRYSIKLTYESSAPQPLIVGQPQHNAVKDGTFHYYYLNVKKKNIKENQNIVAVLSSLKGNADLYVKYIDTPQSSNPEEWELPN